jgi:Cytochrome P460
LLPVAEEWFNSILLLEGMNYMISRPVLLLLITAVTMAAQQNRFSRDGQLMRPESYREWIFLSSGLGMTYGFTAKTGNTSPHFDNVFVEPRAYRTFLDTGTWPEGTIFALEVRTSATNGSINRGGHYQEGVVGLEAEMKDSSRFPNKWAFFDFSNPETRTAKPIPRGASCYSCHAENGAVDNTFVQFYPTLLPVARAKGTLKKASNK